MKLRNLRGELFSSNIMWWLGDWIRLILHQLPLPRKEPEKGKRYFGLYLLAGGLKPYDMESDIETATALTKTREVSNHIRYGIRYRKMLAGLGRVPPSIKGAAPPPPGMRPWPRRGCPPRYRWGRATAR